MHTSYAQINAGNDTIVCDGNPVVLQAQTFGNFGTSSYSFETIPYAPEAYAGTSVSLFDDDVTGALPIGFNFCFLGNDYTQFYIGSNGWISFSAGQTTAYTSATIPNAGAAVPKNCIMGPWEDWNPGIGGNIYYQTIGTTPNRKLVVSWDAVPMFSCTQNLGTFQIVCHETTGIIENHLTTKPNCPTWAGGTGTQGVHNDAGTVAFVAPGRNSTQWTTTNESTRFVPNGITWYQAGNGNPVGFGDSLAVTPNTTTDYVAEITLCGGATFTDTVQVVIANALTFNNTEIPTGCVGPTGVGIVSVNGGQTGFDYSWSPGGYTDSIATGLAVGTYTVAVTDTASGCVANTQIVITSPPPVVLTTGQTDILCNGDLTGDVLVSASGGVGGVYSYQWDDTNNTTTPALTGVGAGTYTVIVIDTAGCSDTVSVTLTEPTALGGTIITTVDASCNGGSDGNGEVGGTGGTQPYTYDWNGLGVASGDAYNLPAGTYTVTITDDNGCTFDQDIIISEPAPIAINTTTTLATCGVNDGSATASASSGSAPYTYQWDAAAGNQTGATASNLGAGTYGVTITDDNGCVSTGSVTVTDTLDINANFVASPVEGIAPLDVSFSNTTSGNPASFFWDYGNGQTETTTGTSTSMQFVTPGTYVVTMTATNAGGCTSSYSVTIIVTNESTLSMPNVFSPNGDGLNDVFRPTHEALVSFNCVILNRWGKEVHSFSNPDEGWDGSGFNAGTYFYLVTAEGEEGKLYELKGTLTLILSED